MERLRVEAARERIEAGVEAIEQVAAATGFGDPERMRRAFLRAFGQPPQALRRAARAELRDAAQETEATWVGLAAAVSASDFGLPASAEAGRGDRAGGAAAGRSGRWSATSPRRRRRAHGHRR